MNMQINPQSDEDSRKQGAIRKKQHIDPTAQIIIRTLICILVIDSLIWGYFKFIKKISVADGLRGWTQGIEKTLGIDQQQKQTIRTKVIIVNSKQKEVNNNTKRVVQEKKKYTTDDQIHDIEIKNKYINDKNNKIYSWKDENGKIHYSNTGFPEGEIEKLWVRSAAVK